MKPRLTVAAAFALALIVPAAAQAAALSSSRACFREGAEAPIVGSGFTPNSELVVALDGRQLTDAAGNPATQEVNAAGGFVGGLTLGSISRSEQMRTLTMTTVVNGVQAPQFGQATLNLVTTKLYVASKPDRFRPGQRLRLRAGGFYGGGKTLWAHVRGPRKRTVRVGTLRGHATGCGKVTARRRISRRTDPVGTYTVQYDTRKRYRAGTRPAVRRGHLIFRKFRPASLPKLDFSQYESSYSAG